MILTAQQILDCNDLTERLLPVPEWGGDVRLRAFTKAQEQDIRNAAKVAGEIDTDRLEVLMVVYGLAEPSFTVAQAELLRQKSAKAFDRVFRAILELNSMEDGAVEKAVDRFPSAS